MTGTIRKITALTTLAMLAPCPAFAYDATVTVSGSVLAPSCEVDSSTVNQTVSMGTAQIADFTSIGSTGNPTPFRLKLLNCAAGTKVTLTVSGTVDTVPSVLKSSGTATQVGVQLLQAGSDGAVTGSPLSLNSDVGLGTVDNTNTMVVPFVAQFYRLGAMTGGTVTATATVNFTYN